jgi:hypothetical protein
LRRALLVVREPSVRLLGLLAMIATGAWAQDDYEIQVYNSDTAAPGVIGFELHFNHVARGAPAGLTHLTLEPHVGLASWCEAGAYFQTVLSADGRYDFAGVKGRFKARWPEKLLQVVGVSLNTEVAFGGIPDGTGAAMELRPIVDADFERVYLSFNPVVAVELTGVDRGLAALEPGLKAGAKLTDWLLLGAEYYGAWGPSARGGPVLDQSERVFAAVDASWRAGRASFELNAAVGYGFVGAEKLIVKLIFATDFE